jgi:chromate transporter
MAWVYVRFGNLPQIAGLLYGVKPAVIVLVIEAVWKLARAAARTVFLGVLGLATVAATLAGAGALAVIAGAGAVAGFAEWSKRTNRGMAAAVLSGVAAIALASQFAPPFATGEPGGTIGLHNVFLYFLRTGSVIYGGGLVLMAFLEKDLVAGLHWVTSKQLLDAIAIGQVTPGPVFTTATFIGYVLLGLRGALVATAGIFLPSFVFCAISGPFIPVLRRSQVASEFLNGVNVASVALMAVVSWDLARAALVDPLTIGLAAGCVILLALTKIRFGWLLLACGLTGAFVHRF